MLKNLGLLLLLAVSPMAGHAEDLLVRDYEGFTLKISCSERIAKEFDYFLIAPTGNTVVRTNNFHMGDLLPISCQQISLKPYSSVYKYWMFNFLNSTNHTGTV